MAERDDEMTDWMPAPYKAPDPAAPFTAQEFADLKDEWEFHGGWKPHRELVARLVATVEQTRRERDAALAVICQLTDDWDPEEQADPCAHAWTPDEVDAIRRARAAPGAEEDQ